MRKYTDHELESFVIRSAIPSALRTASPEFLCDLHDFIFNFGILIPENNLRVMYLPEYDLNLNIDSDHAIKTIFLFPGEPDIKINNSECYELDLCSSKGYLIWSKSITVDQVAEAIKSVDEVHDQAGNIDDKGCRKYLGLTGCTKKLVVEKMFSEIGTVMPVKKSWVEKTLKGFDEPEKLLSYEDGDTVFLFHKRDELYLELKSKVVTEVLKRYGVTDLADVDLDIIKDEVKKMLNQLLDGKDTP